MIYIGDRVPVPARPEWGVGVVVAIETFPAGEVMCMRFAVRLSVRRFGKLTMH